VVSGAASSRVARLWVQNFKGYERFELALSDFNVLAGANNSGKSTLLQAAELVFRLVDLHRQGNHLTTGRNISPAVLPVAHLRDVWYRQRYRAGNAFVPAIVGAEFQDGAFVEFGIIGPFGAANSRLLRSGGIDEERLNVLASRPAVWVPSSVGVVRDEEYRPPARRQGMIAAGRHNEILRNELLDLSRRPAEFEELQRLLRTYFGGQLGNVRFNDLVDQFVTVEYSEASVRHDLYSVGAGFLQVLQLLSFILSRSPGVILLDEPDAHLHSSLQRTVIDVLDDLSRTRQMQVVLSTHSKEIINYVDPSRLILIEKGSTTALGLSEAASQLTILQSLGAIDSVDAYALVRNKRCLFVEGPSDIAMVERLAARLGLTVFGGDDRVVVIPTGGADRFEHVKQLTVFEAALGAPVISYEIRDRDARTDAARSSAAAAPARPLHILDKDCIESYLIHPDVLARVVASVSTERGGSATPTSSEIERIALDVSEEMKDAAIDRAAERYAQDRYRATRAYPPIPEANAAARTFVDTNWTTLTARLRVLHGKLFLGALRSRLQVDYGVSFGNPRLVEEFTVGEIDAELASVLREVAAVTGSPAVPKVASREAAASASGAGEASRSD